MARPHVVYVHFVIYLSYCLSSRMDYHIKRCSRHCATSGRELADGETFYTVLMADGATVERHDYSTECWQGPPDDALGWWQSQMPTQKSKRAKMAPNDVLLHVFEELWQSEDSDADLVYVLALLLVRRRIVRIEDPNTVKPNTEELNTAAPSTEESKSGEPGTAEHSTDQPQPDKSPQQTFSVYCPRNETSYELAASPPDEARIEAIQEELARLLFAEAA